MDVRADRESDAVAAVTVSRLCYWLIKSYFDIWNSASRASLTKWKESISCPNGPRHLLLSGPKLCSLMKVNFAFPLEIRVPESGGREERHRIHVA